MIKSIKYVDLFISSGERVCRIVESRLPAFTLTRQHEGDRIVPGPDGTAYAAIYRVLVWAEHAGRRLVWFSLESQIPHMSSIVACIGFPAPGSSWPVLVINMNLKRHLGSYGTIVGVRGGPLSMPISEFIPVVSPTYPKPLLVKDLPRGFRGVRCIFDLSETAIDWSMSSAECAVVGWLKATENCSEMHDPAPREGLDTTYAEEMKDLHRDGGVFDAVFGEEWVSTLFNDCVFNTGQLRAY